MRKLSFFILALAMSAPLLAVETGPSLALPDLVREAVNNNPELRAARARRDAVRAQVAGAGLPDKPRVDFERMYAPRGGDLANDAEEKSVAVSQELRFPTAWFLERGMAKKSAAMADAEYEIKERAIVAQVKAAYAMLYLSHHTIHVFEENVELMRRFARAAESKYAAGKSMQVDVLKAQVELSKMLNMLYTVRQERETAELMLNTLLNRPADAALGMPDEIELSSSAVAMDFERLAEARPEVRRAKLGADRARSAARLAATDYLPDFMLLYRERSMEMGPDSRDAIVGLSLPLWFPKQRGMSRAAAAERRMAEAEYDASRAMTRYEAKNLAVRAETAGRLVALYRTSVLPQAEQALRIATAAYESDRGGFFEVLDAVRTLRDFRLEHYQHAAEQVTAMADLERLVGADAFPQEASR